MVVAAGTAPSADADSALANLYEAYWYPLYAFLRARGYGVEEAQDLVQAFFLHVLEKRALTAARPRVDGFAPFFSHR